MRNERFAPGAKGTKCEPSASTTEACRVKPDDRKAAGSGVYAEGLADFLFLGLASWGGQKV